MLDSDALQAINQGLAQQELSNTQAKNSFTHILRTMFVQQPEFPWQNLAFLNTACYGTVKSLASHSNSIHRQQSLQNVDQILWIVDARQGGVSKEELDFLQSLQLYRPVFFVLTQIDALSKLQCQKLIEQIRHTLYKSQIPLAGVMAWRANSNTPFVAGDDVSLWLNGLNNTAKRTGIRFEYTRVMDEYIEFHQNSLVDNPKRLSLLNKFSMLAKLHQANESISLQTDLKQAVSQLKQTQTNAQQQKNVLIQFEE